jgi:hypothetical protein
MRQALPVRFREGQGVQLPRATRFLLGYFVAAGGKDCVRHKARLAGQRGKASATPGRSWPG